MTSVFSIFSMSFTSHTYFPFSLQFNAFALQSRPQSERAGPVPSAAGRDFPRQQSRRSPPTQMAVSEHRLSPASSPESHASPLWRFGLHKRNRHHFKLLLTGQVRQSQQTDSLHSGGGGFSIFPQRKWLPAEQHIIPRHSVADMDDDTEGSS